MVRAEEDFDVATNEMARGDKAPFATIAFLSQQCIEKYLKALLVLHAVEFEKTHDLEILLGMVPPSVGLKLAVVDMVTLGPYAIEGRYPGSWDPPTRQEGEAAYGIARKSREAIRLLLPQTALIS